MSFLQLVLSLDKTIRDLILFCRQCHSDPYRNSTGFDPIIDPIIIIKSKVSIITKAITIYKARHAHKRLYTVLPKYSKIQVLPGITSCRLVKDNKQAIELNSLLINNMPKGGYG